MWRLLIKGRRDWKRKRLLKLKGQSNGVISKENGRENQDDWIWW